MRRPETDQPAEADAPPRIAVAIQHTAIRAPLLPRLLEALGGGWHGDPQVVQGGEPGNPWTTYRACLSLANVWLDASNPRMPPDPLVGPTHLLVIQDDALPVARFRERALASVAARPGDLLCFYVPQLPAYMGRQIHAAFGRGEAFATLPTGMFTPVVAAVWPIGMAADCLAWWETAAQPRHRRSDDAQVARYLRSRRVFATGAVPSLVEHDEQVPSLLGLGRYRRTAAILAPADS